MISQLLKEIIKNTLNTSNFSIEELRGGFSKQVYKITTQADNFILYIWQRPHDNKLTENQTRGIEYLFPDGFTYYTHNSKLLTDLGIRVPHILTAGYHADGDFDYAIVEYFKGQNMYEYMNSVGNTGAVADKIMEVMGRMAAKKRSFYGPPVKNKPIDISPGQLVYDFTAEELNIASKLDKDIADIQPNILHLMQQKMNEITETKNQEYSLIHGELTPDHVYILENGEVGLIDVDGVKYFDVEFDWALINLTYGNMMPIPKSINTEKFEFYKLCWKIEYVSVATDYLINVDGNHNWFRNSREKNLRDLKLMMF